MSAPIVAAMVPFVPVLMLSIPLQELIDGILNLLV
jgi:hypothetical protein